MKLGHHRNVLECRMYWKSKNTSLEVKQEACKPTKMLKMVKFLLCELRCICTCALRITWTCQSISQYKPSRRPHQDPAPRSQWLYPQIAASEICTPTHTRLNIIKTNWGFPVCRRAYSTWRLTGVGWPSRVESTWHKLSSSFSFRKPASTHMEYSAGAAWPYGRKKLSIKYDFEYKASSPDQQNWVTDSHLGQDEAVIVEVPGIIVAVPHGVEKKHRHDFCHTAAWCWVSARQRKQYRC